MAIDWAVAGNVVFSGLIIVFFILVMLILLITLMGKALSLKKPAREAAPASVAVPVPAAVHPVAAPQAAAVAGDSGEVIAVISAAVSAYMEETAPGAAYAVTGIHPRPGRVKDSRPAWGFAGMRQNTEPF
jgi:sodium pump decarboxylase gamma subunit